MQCGSHEVKKYAEGVQYDFQEMVAWIMKENQGIRLPFDHTLEAECLGLTLDFHLENGLFVKSGEIKKMDLSIKRYQVLMQTISYCHMESIPFYLNITGPLTLLSYEYPLAKLFKNIKNNDENIFGKMKLIQELMCHYLNEAYEKGARRFYFSDPLCEKALIGPDFYKQIVELNFPKLLNTFDHMPLADLYLCPRFAQGIEDVALRSYRGKKLIHQKTCIHNLP